jgi:inosine-uridine nucleoside N-ribohydrolase
VSGLDPQRDRPVWVHLDTDIGGDVDDICALAMLLGWPGARISAITTVGDDRGRRAGLARRALEIAGRRDVPVAAGVDVASGRYPYPLGLPSDVAYWGGPVEPLSGPVDEALDLLRRSIDADAVIAAVGPLSNLAELEARTPGVLARARLVIMGGYVGPTRTGFPPWGAADDFNVQVDVAAAAMVFAHASPTLVPLSVTVETQLRRAHVPALRRAGGLAALLARQAALQARRERTAERWMRRYPALPDDGLAFLHDPLACAVAVGWRDGVRLASLPVVTDVRDGRLRQRVEADGKPTEVVVEVDGPMFAQTWLRAVCGRAEPDPAERG